MGVYDVYCLLCGGPIGWSGELHTDDGEEIYVSDKKGEFTWLNKLYLIPIEGEKIEVLARNYDQCGGFDVNNERYEVTPMGWEDCDSIKSIICHVDCYKSLTDITKLPINFNMVNKIEMDQCNCLLKNKSHYGYKMKNYTGEQDAPYYDMYYNDKWLLESPLNNEINKNRIHDIWKNILEE